MGGISSGNTRLMPLKMTRFHVNLTENAGLQQLYNASYTTQRPGFKTELEFALLLHCRPDLARLGEGGLDKDTCAVMARRAYDVAACERTSLYSLPP